MDPDELHSSLKVVLQQVRVSEVLLYFHYSQLLVLVLV